MTVYSLPQHSCGLLVKILPLSLHHVHMTYHRHLAFNEHAVVIANQPTPA